MRALALATAVFVALATAVVAPDAASAAASSTFFVDCSRHMAGTGTAASPWNSIAAVDEHGAYSPGDRILFRRGTTCKGMLAPSGDGTRAHPIVIGAYGTGTKPTIAGGGTGTWQGAILLTDQQWWTIQDLHVTNTDGGQVSPYYRSGVLLLDRGDSQLQGLIVQRLTVDHVTSRMADDVNGSRSFGGISAITLPGGIGGFTDLLIRDNIVDHVGRTGIIVSNTSWGTGRDVRPRITGNRVSSTRGDGIVMLGAWEGRIDHNTSAYANSEWPCSDCGGINSRTANVAIWTGSSQSVRIDHNEAYGTMAKGGDGEGFDVDIDAVDTVVEDNYAHDNEGGGILVCGSTGAVVRFNILQNNRGGSFTFIGSLPATRTSIYNNTVYISAKTNGMPVRTIISTGGSDLRFFNNVIYNLGTGTWLWPFQPTTLSNTLVGNLGTGAPRTTAASYQDAGLKRPGSGGIGFSTLSGYAQRSTNTGSRGIAISTSVRTDFFGKVISARHPPRGAAG